MESKHIVLPDPEKQEYGYRLAFRLALERLRELNDIPEQCRRAGAEYLSSQSAASIDYLGHRYLIDIKNGDISPEGAGSPLPLREKILVLDYFTQAKGTPLTGRMITYQELLDGMNYFPVFSKRTIQPLVRFFGEQPERLTELGYLLNGKPADFGGVAVTISAFPRVPVTLVLWKGDEEFPPAGSITFDSTIPDYLTNDDIHTLCETIIWKMVKLLKAG